MWAKRTGTPSCGPARPRATVTRSYGGMNVRRPLRSTILVKAARLGLVVCATVFGALVSDADNVIDATKLFTLTDIYALIQERKFDMALDRLRPLAAQGNSEAEFVLGYM